MHGRSVIKIIITTVLYVQRIVLFVGVWIWQISPSNSKEIYRQKITHHGLNANTTSTQFNSQLTTNQTYPFYINFRSNSSQSEYVIPHHGVY